MPKLTIPKDTHARLLKAADKHGTTPDTIAERAIRVWLVRHGYYTDKERLEKL